MSCSLHENKFAFFVIEQGTEAGMPAVLQKHFVVTDALEAEISNGGRASRIAGLVCRCYAQHTGGAY
jgi:hypothetical protein